MVKSEKLLNFGAKNIAPSFLIFNTKIIFNHLYLAFIKALIFRYFNQKNHISIKTNIVGYTINDMLNQLTFWTSLDGIVIKTNLG